VYNYGILDQFYEICADSVHLTIEEQNDVLTAAGLIGLSQIKYYMEIIELFDFVIWGEICRKTTIL